MTLGSNFDEFSRHRIGMFNSMMKLVEKFPPHGIIQAVEVWSSNEVEIGRRNGRSLSQRTDSGCRRGARVGIKASS